jgi:hypothetical protein
MKNPSILIVAATALLASFAVGCAGAAMSPKDVANDAEKLKGQKVKVSGVYTQGFSNGGRPTDPWALVIGEAPSIQPTVSCLIPAKVDIAGRYPKITAEGTVLFKSGDRVYLTECTYTLD